MNPLKPITVTHAQLEEARAYANFSIKEGYSTEEDWENLTDEEFVAKARELGDKGDILANTDEF